MINISEPLLNPVFQHLIPVMTYETSEVVGFVPIASSMFLHAGKYILWNAGPEIQLDCVTQPRSFTSHGLKIVQFLAIVYKKHELNKRFNLKGFISTASKQNQYQAQWISIKPGAFKLYDVNIFKPFFTGTWDTSEEYDRAHQKNEDYNQSLSQVNKEQKTLGWCLNVPASKFLEDYDYIEADWIKMFHTSLAKRKLEDDTPESIEISQPVENAAFKVSLLGRILEAGQNDKYPNSSLPSTLQIMRLHEVQPGIYPFFLTVQSAKKQYIIKVSIILKA